MEKGGVNFWIIGFFVLLGVVLFAVGTFFPNFISKKTIPAPTSTLLSPTGAVNLTGEPTTAISPTLAPTVANQKSDFELIRQAMADKYNRPVGEVELTVSKNTGIYASGGVKFSGEIGGGWFLAYKDAGGWLIVQDGNGTVSCETIAPYNFPNTIVPECVDKDGNLITR